MKTTGSGSEGIFILVPVLVTVGAAVLLAGGPHELMDYIDLSLVHAARVVSAWVLAHI